MFKKGYSSFLAVVFSLILMLSMTACGSDDASTEPENNEPTASTQEPAAEPEVIVEVEECDEEEILRGEAEGFFNATVNHNNQWAPDAFAEQLTLARDTVFVLDIRRGEDYTERHVEGAINADFSAGQVAGVLNELPTDKEIGVMCYTGQTAGQTVGVLRMLGYNAKVVTGGFNNGIVPNEDLFEFVTQ